MPTLLKDLTLTRIDFVDDGANPGARLMLFKRKETPMAEPTKQEPGTPDITALAKRATDAEAATVELKKRLEEIEKQAKADAEEVIKMREMADRNAAIEVAKAFTPLAKQDDLASIVQKAKRAFDAPTYETFVGILKAATEKVRMSDLLAERGVSGTVEKADSPQGKMDQLAKKYAEDHKVSVAKAHTTLSKSDAEYRAAANEEYEAYARRNGGR